MIDFDKTKKYYSLLREGDLCSCNYCKSYYLQVKNAYPKIDSYLNEIGVDIEKPFELSSVKDDDGTIKFISCQYVVFGDIKDDFTHKIDDITICISSDHPTTGIKQNHFILEIYPIMLRDLF